MMTFERGGKMFMRYNADAAHPNRLPDDANATELLDIMACSCDGSRGPHLQMCIIRCVGVVWSM